MTIATRTGDDGNTRRFGGRRVPKDDPRIECSGAVEELNAHLALARVSPIPLEIDEILVRIQAELCDLVTELQVCREDPELTDQVRPFPVAAVDGLEEDLRAFEDRLPPSTEHLMPGGHHGAVMLHVARAICRRAERHVVTLARHERIPGSVIQYLNRLGDLLFVMARDVNTRNGTSEPLWHPREVREMGDD